MDYEDFTFRNPLAAVESGKRRTFVWRAYSRYWHKGYSSAAEGAEVVREYEPLLDTPDLFLEFAKTLGNPSPSLEIAKTLFAKMPGVPSHSPEDIPLKDLRPLLPVLWVRNYGLLGLSPADSTYQRPGSNQRISQQEIEDSLPLDPSMSKRDKSRKKSLFKDLFIEEYSDRGGPEETSIILLREAYNAYRTLALYKAALSKDVEKLEEAMDLEGTMKRMPGSRKAIEEYFLRRRSESRSDIMVDLATVQIETDVQRVLSRFAYPCLNVELSNSRSTEEENKSPQLLTPSLWPRNLLGAMYLQFYWMVGSASELSNCKHCGNPISYAPTMPGSVKRKTYKNKKFCSKQCRQNYYYHHHRKHRSQGS